MVAEKSGADLSVKDLYNYIMDGNDQSSAPFRLGILPVPGFALMSYACTVEPFRAANLLAGRTLYQITHHAAAAQVESSGDAVVPASDGLEPKPDVDLVLVIAGGDPMRFRDQTVLDWLRRQARRGLRLGGVSGGPVILANAGLMAGRRMTVHWEHASALSAAHPDLLLERSLYVVDRDRVTCGGGIAPLDMAHHLIAMHHGPEFAQGVTDWFLHTHIRPPGGAQRLGLAERLGTTSVPVLAAVGAMEAHIADGIDLAGLARAARVTPRHLNRLFRARLGCSTMAYFRELRLEHAVRLLTRSALPLTEVALATGFASSSHFSRCFRAKFGHAPSEIRN